jgi:hypothetical protein
MDGRFGSGVVDIEEVPLGPSHRSESAMAAMHIGHNSNRRHAQPSRKPSEAAVYSRKASQHNCG